MKLWNRFMSWHEENFQLFIVGLFFLSIVLVCSVAFSLYRLAYNRTLALLVTIGLTIFTFVSPFIIDVIIEKIDSYFNKDLFWGPLPFWFNNMNFLNLIYINLFNFFQNFVINCWNLFLFLVSYKVGFMCEFCFFNWFIHYERRM